MYKIEFMHVNELKSPLKVILYAKKGPKRHFLSVFCQKSTFPVKFFRQIFLYKLTHTNPKIVPNFMEIRGLSFFCLFGSAPPTTPMGRAHQQALHRRHGSLPGTVSQWQSVSHASISLRHKCHMPFSLNLFKLVTTGIVFQPTTGLWNVSKPVATL